jgi:hypothetical protein
MKRVRPEEVGATDLGTLVQGPEQVYIATAIQPPNDTQIITVHRTLEGAKQQIESLPGAQGRVDKQSILP